MLDRTSEFRVNLLNAAGKFITACVPVELHPPPNPPHPPTIVEALTAGTTADVEVVSCADANANPGRQRNSTYCPP